MEAIAAGYRPGAPPTTYVDAPALTPDDLSKAFQVNAATLNGPTAGRQAAEDRFVADLTNMVMNRRPNPSMIALAKANDFHAGSAARGQARDFLGPSADDKDVGFVAKLTRLMNGPGPTAAPAGGITAPSGVVRLPTTDPRYIALSDKSGGGYFDIRANAEAQFEQTMLQMALADDERRRRTGLWKDAGVDPARAALYEAYPALAANDPMVGRRTPDVGERAPRSFMVDGKPVEGFADKTGRFYGADGSLITGAVTPYVSPRSPRSDRSPSIVSSNLRGQFNQDQTFKDAQQIAAAYQKIRAAATGRHTATSDMSLVYGLMKMQDPGSTVREGEYASAENAKGVPDAVRNFYNKVIDGAILSEAQREQFLQTAGSIAQAQRSVFQGTLQRYSDIARRQQLDPAEVVFDPFDGLEFGTRGPADWGGDINLGAPPTGANPFLSLPRSRP
jgi:hypothetical protein